jgi:hypothetical protein
MMMGWGIIESWLTNFSFSFNSGLGSGFGNLNGQNTSLLRLFYKLDDANSLIVNHTFGSDFRSSIGLSNNDSAVQSTAYVKLSLVPGTTGYSTSTLLTNDTRAIPKPTTILGLLVALTFGVIRKAFK